MTTKKKASKEKKLSVASLPAVRPMVAGIDIGSSQHWVCGPALEGGGPNLRVFGTTTAQLNELADWLVEQRVESVAMESTYVYWIPVYELLESRGLEVVLANARQLHNVPGRKTDFADCQLIQLLHSCGLLRGSFRPSEAIGRMRAVQRQMANLVNERTRCVQWMQKSLDQMNVQVHRAVSDITGDTGMAIIRAIIAGERDPERLSVHRDPRCRKSAKEIAQYLVGTWREEHLFNLASALRLFDTFGQEIAAYEAQLLKELEGLQPPERREAPVPRHPNPAKEKAIRGRGDQELRTTLWRFAGVDLTRIDGVSAAVAQVVLTEVGTDLSAFLSEDDFISWLRLCPRTPISGGKPLKKRRNGLGANRISPVRSGWPSPRCSAQRAPWEPPSEGRPVKREVPSPSSTRLARSPSTSTACFVSAKTTSTSANRRTSGSTPSAAWSPSRKPPSPWALPSSRGRPCLR
jgi:transposase